MPCCKDCGRDCGKFLRCFLCNAKHKNIEIKNLCLDCNTNSNAYRRCFDCNSVYKQEQKVREMIDTRVSIDGFSDYGK